MTIGMLLNAPYPDDVRIRKEASALQQAGFRVCLLCLRRKDEPYQEIVDGISIERIDAGKSNFQLAFWDIVLSKTFVHPRFEKVLPQWISKNSIHVLHVHDLPLVGTALKAKGRLGVKVVADFHENYPDALSVWFKWKKNPLAHLKNRLFLNPMQWVKHEATAVKQSDYIIAVVDEMKERLINRYKADPNKIKVVTNSEDQSFLKQEVIPEIYGKYRSKFIVTYTGNIGPHRGVDLAIDAMNYLKGETNILLTIVGSGSDAVMESLKKKVKITKLEDQVVFFGRQPFSKFYSYMHFADVNIIPHKSNSHTDNTIPHKLFQGMMAGKPMLVSSSAPLKRIIDTTQAGLVFHAGDSKDIADKILTLYNNKQLCSQLGRNGIKATQENGMNWENDQLTLVDLYKNL